MKTKPSQRLLQPNMLFFYCLLLCINTSVIHAKSTDFNQSCKKNEQLSVKDLAKLDIAELLTTISTKTPKKISEIPSSTTVFKREDMINMGINTIEELLNFVPGFQATRESVGGQGYRVAARGSSTPQASFHILFMIDGLPISNDISGGALMPNRFMPVENFARVEIIRGPGSAIYGTGAFTGVVNMVTEKNTNEIAFRIGNDQRYQVHTNLAVKCRQHTLALFTRYADGDGELYGEDITRPINPFVASTRDATQEKDFTLQYGFGGKFSLYLRSTQRDFPDFFGFNSVNNGLVFHQSEQNSAHFKYEAIDKRHFKLIFQGAYTQTKQRRQNTDLSDTKLIQQKENEWRIGTDIHYKGFKKHSLLVGMMFRKPRVETAQFTNTNISNNELTGQGLLVREGSRHSLGIYAQDQYEFAKKWMFTFGGRYDRYSDFGSSFNPRLGLVYNTPFNSTLKLLYGQAFRAPSVRQTSSFNLGNSALRAESIKTLEFVWNQQHTLGNTSLTVFHNTQKDTIDTVFKTPTSRQFVNISDEQKTSGLELESSLRFNRRFNIRLHYSHFLEQKENPRTIAQQTFSIITNYQYNQWNFNVSAWYHGKMEQLVRVNRQVKTIELDDYWVTNAAIRYKLTPKLTLSARVHNLFDEKYYSPTKMFAFQQGLINRSRHYLLSVEYAL